MKRRTTIKNARRISRMTLTEAKGLFLQHCRIRNLNKSTLSYYEEDIGYFSKCMPEIVYVDEIIRDVVETFLGRELDNGKKVSSLNTVLMQTFNAFCAGVAYCAVYLRTGSIIPSIVLHALWDGATFLDPAQLAGGGAAMTTIAVPKNTLAGVPVEYQAIYPVIMAMAVCSIGAIELGYGLFLLRKSKWAEIKEYFTE